MAADMPEQINRTLAACARQLDAIEEIDVETADGKVVLEFENGVKIIVSRQSATNQIWVAEPGGGWRFDWKDGGWRSEKLAAPLPEFLSGLVSLQLGTPVHLSADM